MPADRELFVRYGCYQCHGYEGQGGEALRIAPSPYSFEAFAAKVRKPANEMPAYAPEVLSDARLAGALPLRARDPGAVGGSAAALVLPLRPLGVSRVARSCLRGLRAVVNRMNVRPQRRSCGERAHAAAQRLF